MKFPFLMTLALAATSAPDFSVAIRHETTRTLLVLSPPAGLHFNTEAPLLARAQNSVLHVIVKTPNQVAFALDAATGATVHYTATAFLCDNAKTFCEKHVVTGDLKIPVATAASPQVSPPQAVPPPANHAAQTARTQGFIYNDAERALLLARRQHRPILIDFFGIWCPPCNILDNTVFSSPEFQYQASRFVKLKLDADQSASWALKQRYKIAGYPTVVFTDEKGDEITRIVGSRDKSAFLKQMDAAYLRRALPFTTLLRQADKGDNTAALPVGMTYLERHEFELAVKYLSQSGKDSHKLYEARIGLAREKAGAAPESKQYLLSSLRDAFDHSITGVFKFSTGQELAELYADLGQKEKQQLVLTEVKRVTQDLLTHPELLKDEELTAADLWESLGDSYRSQHFDAEAKQAYGQAAKEFEKLLKALPAAAARTDRGYRLELATCWGLSGHVALAKDLYRRLERQYPEEFTFPFAHSRLLFEEKNLGAAEATAHRAFLYSYGDNKLRVTNLLAQIYIASGKKTAAGQLLAEVLAATPAPEDSFNRTNRYLKQLKSLQEGLQK